MEGWKLKNKGRGIWIFIPRVYIAFSLNSSCLQKLQFALYLISSFSTTYIYTYIQAGMRYEDRDIHIHIFIYLEWIPRGNEARSDCIRHGSLVVSKQLSNFNETRLFQPQTPSISGFCLRALFCLPLCNYILIPPSYAICMYIYHISVYCIYILIYTYK